MSLKKGNKMYKVCYYIPGSTQVNFRSFETFSDAVEFANGRQKDSVLEIKYYDDEDKRKPDRN